MAFDDQFQRAFETLAGRVREEIARQLDLAGRDLKDALAEESANAIAAAASQAADEARQTAEQASTQHAAALAAVETRVRDIETKVREEGHAAGLEEGRRPSADERRLGWEEGHQQGRQEAKEEGRREGREEGREEGRHEGREQGRQDGREQGLKEGIEEGRRLGRAEGAEEGYGRGVSEGRQLGLTQGQLANDEVRRSAFDEGRQAGLEDKQAAFNAGREEGRAEASAQFEEGRRTGFEAAREAIEEEARIAAALTSEQAPPAKSSGGHVRLASSVRAIDAAQSLSEVLEVLTAGAGHEVPRAAVLLVQGAMLRGWRFAGFGEPLDSRPTECHVSLSDAGFIQDAVRNGASVEGESEAARPAFASGAHPSGMTAMPLVLSGQVVAVLYADHGDAAQDVDTRDAVAALEILARHATRSLEAMTAVRAAQKRAETERRPQAGARPDAPRW